MLETGAGRAVLRRFPVGDDAAVNEARTLTVLDGLDGFAPRLPNRSTADRTTSPARPVSRTSNSATSERRRRAVAQLEYLWKVASSRQLEGACQQLDRIGHDYDRLTRVRDEAHARL
ncbi:hypothetical protein GCM10009527_033310 [Actinomadura nitritigenes]|uniref:Uncharacterized protein n=1 Tax=Actinomadura nitritigenes TaxID=134602 RepID=A0ABS3RBA1_9ACTN|nr:hypothetical protein [Actinomadura nitritigenes]MBO2443502.1 hypothetical protein [Actinomadura nitritigenes]